ncbi:hypothetical protein ABZT47_30720 [Sphaerisporangium sp. NPDC005289]|uniref:hypothetical protein n=1 Tax=Sphaerisporangium sp. NPDC005289 TaxID=3155247 RepID=UPI0033B1BF28
MECANDGSAPEGRIQNRPAADPMILFDHEFNARGSVTRSMPDTLIDRARLSGISHFEASIRQSDHSARTMARRCAGECDTQVDLGMLLGEWEFPVDHDTEVLCRAGPLPAQRS